MDGLLDEPRVDAPRTVSDARVEEVVNKTNFSFKTLGRRALPGRHASNLRRRRSSAAFGAGSVRPSSAASTSRRR